MIGQAADRRDNPLVQARDIQPSRVAAARGEVVRAHPLGEVSEGLDRRARRDGDLMAGEGGGDLLGVGGGRGPVGGPPVGGRGILGRALGDRDLAEVDLLRAGEERGVRRVKFLGPAGSTSAAARRT